MRTSNFILALVALYFVSAPASANDAAGKSTLFGFGLGVPYGVLGSSAEFFVSEHISLAAGAGTTILAGPAGSVGARLYAGQSSGPNVGLYYGTAGIVETGYEQYEKHGAMVLTAGQQWLWGKNRGHGLDVNLALILGSGIQNRAAELGAEKPGRVKLSLGYKFAR